MEQYVDNKSDSIVDSDNNNDDDDQIDNDYLHSNAYFGHNDDDDDDDNDQLVPNNAKDNLYWEKLSESAKKFRFIE